MIKELQMKELSTEKKHPKKEDSIAVDGKLVEVKHEI